ncbi:MAG: hypothetical protein AB7F53_01510 [Nitrososphaeraceae archaeon]
MYKRRKYHEIVEKLVDHKILSSRNSYLLFNPQTLLEGTKYLKGYVPAIEALTINEENRLKKKNLELKKQDNYNQFLIQKQMKETAEHNWLLTTKMEEYGKASKKLYEL